MCPVHSLSQSHSQFYLLFRFPLLLYRFSRNCNKVNCELLVSLSNENIYFWQNGKLFPSPKRVTRRSSFVWNGIRWKGKNGTNGHSKNRRKKFTCLWLFGNVHMVVMLIHSALSLVFLRFLTQNRQPQLDIFYNQTIYANQ